MKIRCGSYTLDSDRDKLVDSVDDWTGGHLRRRSLHISKAGHFSMHTTIFDRSGQVLGEDLRGITDEDARDWLTQTHPGLEADKADQFIADCIHVSEPPPRTKICVSLTDDDKAALDTLKRITGESTTQLMHRWIAEELKKY